MIHNTKDLKPGYKLVLYPSGKNLYVPPDWNLIALEEAGALKDGDWILNKDYADFGVRLLQISDIGTGHFTDKSNRYISLDTAKKLKCTLVNQGKDILISRMPEPIGRACMSPTLPYPYIVAVDVSIYSIDEKIADHQYLLYSLNNKIYFDQVLQYVSGTTRQRISRKKLEQIKVLLPPFREQQKIANVLSKLDGLIQKKDQIIEQTQKLKKGLMQKLLTKGIAHSIFKKTEIGQVPEEWDVIQLGKAINMSQYGLSLKLSEYGQYPTFRMNNIKNGYMVTNKMKFLDLDKVTFERYKLEKGDLLFNRTNSSDLVGKIGLFDLDGDYTFASYLIRLRVKSEIINPFLFNYYLNTDFMQFRLKSLATPGVGQVNINAENLKSISIPIPTIKEQEKIVSILQMMDKRKQIEASLKKQLSSLKKGLIQKLLTGKIRVKV